MNGIRIILSETYQTTIALIKLGMPMEFGLYKTLHDLCGTARYHDYSSLPEDAEYAKNVLASIKKRAGQ